MKISKGTSAVAAFAVAVGAVLTAPTASADTTSTAWLGQQAKLVNGDVIQGWTISGLKPSTDVIAHPLQGTLWEATATDKAIAGSVIPIISNLNARARNGDTYRVLFGVATPQGVNPATLEQGESTSGKIYFDVVGQNPDSVFYSNADDELALWLTPPPAPTTGRPTASSSTSATSTADQAPAAVSAAAPAAITSSSQGTPMASTSAAQTTTGSQGTLATPAPAAAEVPAAESTPAASEGTPTTVVPQASSGTAAS